MNGRVVQKFIQKGEEGSTAYLVAEDTAANRAEAQHVALNSDVWLNSGEQGKLSGPSDGSAPPPFPKYIAKIPGDYVPKGTQFTTDRKVGIAWLRDLCNKAIPSPLLVGPSVWAQKYRPLKERVDRAAAQGDIGALWAVLQEIRSLPAGAKVADVTGNKATQSAQVYQALKALPLSELQPRADKVLADLDALQPTLGMLSDDNSRAYKAAVEQARFQVSNARDAKTDDEKRVFLARAIHTGEEQLRRFAKEGPGSSILDTAKETAGKAKDAAGSALGAVWDSIPLTYKLLGGGLLGALALNAVTSSSHHHDEG